MTQNLEVFKKAEPRPIAVVMFDFQSTQPNVISLRQGTEVVVLDTLVEQDYWLVLPAGEAKGLFPCRYMQIIGEESMQQAQQRTGSRIRVRPC